MKSLALLSPLLLAAIVLLLPDTTLESIIITQLPWLGFVALVAWTIKKGEFSERASKLSILWAALFGLAYATYLHVTWSQGGIPQCSTGGCEVAQASSYASLFFGIRTALVGIIGYSLVIFSLLIPGNIGRFSTAFLATFGFGTSLYLTFSSVTVLETTCQWCLGSAAAMTTLFALSWWRVWKTYE